jgi:hypothetical protein
MFAASSGVIASILVADHETIGTDEVRLRLPWVRWSVPRRPQ